MARTNEEHQGSGSTTDDLKGKAAEIGQNVRDFAGHASEAAQEQYANLKDAAAGYYQRGRDRAMDLEDGLEDFIREKPVQAILVAAGVGLLIGLMWRRH